MQYKTELGIVDIDVIFVMLLKKPAKMMLNTMLVTYLHFP